MPISEHPVFTKPDGDPLLWRYLDLAKFSALLTSRTLWLSSVETLAADDPHEGTLSTEQFAHRQWKSFDDLPKRIRKHAIEQSLLLGGDGSPKDAFSKYMNQQEQINLMTQFGRRAFYVNCWHAANYESVAMWKLYGAPGAGIAIITTAEKLSEAVGKAEQELYLGQVRYFDDQSEQIDWSNVFQIVMSKRNCFEYEKEVRLLHWATAGLVDPLSSFEWNEELCRYEKLTDVHSESPAGLSVDCDIEALIGYVMVSPYAPDWYAEMIEELRKQLGFKFDVFRSHLLDSPATPS